MGGPSLDHELIASDWGVDHAVEFQLQAIVEDVPQLVPAGVTLQAQDPARLDGDDLHGAVLVESEAAPGAPRARVLKDVREVIHGR